MQLRAQVDASVREIRCNRRRRRIAYVLHKNILLERRLERRPDHSGALDEKEAPQDNRPSEPVEALESKRGRKHNE